MAGKSPRKPSKSKSATKATTQPASTVTPISQQGASVANQASVPVGAQSNTITATQSAAPVTAHSGAPVTMMEEVRTTVIKLADQEIIEQVRVRAYQFFEQRGRQEGHDREDWARAEAEILAKYQREKSA
jgi:Protein of unknown function (DUF2934)